MPTPYQTSIGSFTRKSTFFWSSVGATVGLANLWQFPYLASLHGGGLFVLLYLACLLLVTLPLMVTEAAFGRYARHGIVLALEGLVRSAGCSRAWLWAGRLSLLAAFLVLSFTAVFGAVALAYVFFGATGTFSGASTGEVAQVLSALVSDTGEYRRFMAWHGFFLLLVVWVSVQGVVKGLERTLRLVVPCTLLIMLGLFALVSYQGHMGEAVSRILGFQPQNVSLESFKAALFHAFFTLGLGMGVWTVFGAYTTAHTRFKRSILAVVLMDTLVAILAGLMFFAVAAESGSGADERGFALLFVSLPATLGQYPASQLLITVVFLVVVMIVWATALALMEPIVGWFREWTGAPRGLSAILVGLCVWGAGLVSLLSFNLWRDYRLMGATAFRWLELVSGGVLIPVVAILIALFAGWCMTRMLTLRILGRTPNLIASVWYGVIRFVLPPVVAYIGVMYTAFALSGMCDNGADALWCETRPPAVSRAPESPAEPTAGAAQPQEPAPQPSAQPDPTVESDPPTTPVEQPLAPENAPNDEDILYHSV